MLFSTGKMLAQCDNTRAAFSGSTQSTIIKVMFLCIIFCAKRLCLFYPLKRILMCLKKDYLDW